MPIRLTLKDTDSSALKDAGSALKDADSALMDASCASKTEERSLPGVEHSPKPTSRVLLKFRTLSGQTVDVNFPSKQPPLGIKLLMDSVPVQVVEVEPGSMAALLGVGVGWALVQVNNLDVQCHTPAELQVAIQEEMSRT